MPQCGHTCHHVVNRYSGRLSSQCRGIRCIWNRLGHQGLLEWLHDSWSSSRLSSTDRLLLKWHRNAWIPFPMEQGNGPTSQDEEGNAGLFSSCGGNLGFPVECRRVCRRISSVASRVSSTLSRLKREGGISLKTLQQKRASSCVEVVISWFFWSCGRNLGVPFEL